MAYETKKKPTKNLQDAIAELGPLNVSDYPANFSSSQPNPFALLFGGGNLGGGPSSPDLAQLASNNNLVAAVPETPFPEREAAIARMLKQRHTPTGPQAPRMEEEAPDPNLEAINALMELAGNMPTPSEGGIDIAAIMKEAAGAARKPFQAQIKSTRGQNKRAKADTDYSSEQIRKMYRALSRSNKRAAERESDQSMAAAEQIQGMGQESADQLAAENQARLDASAAQSAALGSANLNAALSTDINANTSEAARQLVENAGLGATATANRGEAERRYLNRQGQNLKLTGTNRAADLYGDLQDYLQGNRDKINELRGQAAAAAGEAKSSAAASAASAQSDMYDQQYRAHQDLLNNQMALLGMKTDLQQQDFDNDMSMEELGLRLQQMQMQNQPDAPLIPGFDNGLVEALPQEQRSALMLQQYLSPETGGTLSKLMQNPALRQGFYTNEQGDKIPIGGNPLNSQQLLQELGMTSSDPQQNFILAQIIAQLASANTDLPYGAQR